MRVNRGFLKGILYQNIHDRGAATLPTRKPQVVMLSVCAFNARVRIQTDDCHFSMRFTVPTSNAVSHHILSWKKPHSDCRRAQAPKRVQLNKLLVYSTAAICRTLPLHEPSNVPSISMLKHSALADVFWFEAQYPLSAKCVRAVLSEHRYLVGLKVRWVSGKAYRGEKMKNIQPQSRGFCKVCPGFLHDWRPSWVVKNWTQVK